jgi:hypothetical protein
MLTFAVLREGEERFRTRANSLHLAWIARDDGFIFCYNQRFYAQVYP